MRQTTAPSELVIDFLVPAAFASRYRARLIALSRLEGQVRLAFRPSRFRTGVLSCPADVSLVTRTHCLRLRGVVEMKVGGGEVIAHFHFDRALERPEFEALRSACQLDAVFAEDRPADAPPPEAPPEELSGPGGDAADTRSPVSLH